MGALIIAPREKPHRGFAGWQRQLQHTWEHFFWEVRGRQGTTPFLAKAAAIRALAQSTGARTLIECGTFCGDMAAALRQDFVTIHSIELSRFFANQAEQRFRDDSQVQIHHGDSASHLPRLLRHQQQPCIIWLDGHYSSGKISRGLRDMPVLLELSTVFSAACSEHWVLLDDAHRFDGQHDYPKLQSVRDLALSFGREAITVQHDIIRIAPPRQASTQSQPDRRTA